tara:strand:- start:1094 stop:2617 length:1524 start_codon:yes stop_codon:yes gene_type:complete
MAYQNIDRKDLIKAIRSRSIKEEMEMIMDVAGQDEIWRHDPNIKYGKWDGKTSFGVKPDQPWISLKTSESAVRRLITRFKNSYIASKNDPIITGSKPLIALFVGTQKIKFQATGKLTDSSGKSVSEATMTEMQELGSAFVFRRAINENASWNSADALKADDVTMNGIKDIWKKVGKVNEVDDTWIENFYKQQKALIKKIGKPNFTEFNRNGGFMEFISDLVKKHYGISGKDNWNPADIWLIQDERKWTSMIKEAVESGRKGRSPAKTVQELNAIMRMLFKARQVFGISLKKVAAGQDATVTFANDKSEFFQSLEKMHFSYIAADCKMGKKKDKEGAITLSTQDTRLYVKDGGNTYNFQIKGNNSTGMSNLKYEPTASGATAARLGKATVELVERLLSDYNLNFTKDNASYPQTAKQFMDDSTDWKGLISILQKNRVQIDAKTADEAYDNLAFVFGTKPHVANSKCQQIKWLSEFLSLTPDDRDNFGTDMVFLAKKEGAAYGPFAKIY